MESNIQPRILTYKEFIEMYGDVMMSFRSYYKYTFYFTGKTADGNTINASYGGSADDIYRYEVDTTPKSLRVLEPNSAYVEDGNYNTIQELEPIGW
jgi:hypothetical protein